MTATTKPGFTAVAVVSDEGGFTIRLDDQTLRSPAGHRYTLPTKALAEAIAQEWRASAPKLPRPEAMPLTRLAATSLDRITSRRADIEAQLLSYAETELLCHRAEAPADLAARQARHWQPLLDWLAVRHDALLKPTTGIVARQQDRQVFAALKAALDPLDPWQLAAVALAVSISGSLVIGLALADGRLTPDQAFDLAELDSSYQIETWGEDAEATERRAGVRGDLELAKRFLDLLAK